MSGGGGGGGVPLGPGGSLNGTAATELIRGSGGNQDSGYSQGGAGGQWGESGLPGSGARPTFSGSGGSGGSPGRAIIGTSLITTLQQGALAGTVVADAALV